MGAPQPRVDEVLAYFQERIEYYKEKRSKINLQNVFEFIEESQYETVKRMGTMQIIALDMYQSIYQGHYAEMIKPVSLENIERYTINEMKEYNEIYDAHKHGMYGIVYKFTLNENGLKRIGKTIDFTGRTGSYISKARTYPSGSNKLNNFHRAIQDALELMKQENKEATIDELRDRLFDYFKVDIYITKNAIDYHGFEDLLTLYENRRDNIEYFDLFVQGKMNPIVGDLFEYTGYLSELGIKDLLLILEECFERGLTQEEALEYFKDKTEQDFTSQDELRTINQKCKKIFSKNYNLALKEYILGKCTDIMTKEDEESLRCFDFQLTGKKSYLKGKINITL